MTVTEFVTKCDALKRKWRVRDKKITDWYDILLMKDELAQTGMESVTSNDPKTGYNLAKHLLTSSIIAHKVDIEDLTPEEISATSQLERFFAKRWMAEENHYRRTGRKGFKEELISLMLATGWYFVFSMVTNNRIWTEVWSPAEVYPDFGDEGLVEVAHIYPMTPAQANRKVKLQDWEVTRPFTTNTKLYDYWGYDNDGDLVNGIVLGRDFVKPLEKDFHLNNLMQKLGEPTIPVFASPIGGLPDRGSIITNENWQKNFGESIVATNEEMTKTYNKMLSFAQQATRSAAQHRWYEKAAGDYQILREEDMDKWGAIFRLGPNDEIGPLIPPAIPVELRTIMFEYSNMLQRGLFPWAVFGNVQQQMSYLAMANVASAAMQTLTPYSDAFTGLMSDLDNYQFNMMRYNSLKPYGFQMPDNLPEKVEFKVQADIEIPGYLIQRATVARMLDPTFRLPTRMVMDKFFPEVRDPLQAMAEARKDEAMNNPAAIMADAVIAYREQAERFRKVGDARSIRAAEVYEKLADSMEAQITGQPQQPTARREASPAEEAIMREAFPTREAARPVEGMGKI
jgi:hypothetical protein